MLLALGLALAEPTVLEHRVELERDGDVATLDVTVRLRNDDEAGLRWTDGTGGLLIPGSASSKANVELSTRGGSVVVDLFDLAPGAEVTVRYRLAQPFSLEDDQRVLRLAESAEVDAADGQRTEQGLAWPEPMTTSVRHAELAAGDEVVDWLQITTASPLTTVPDDARIAVILDHSRSTGPEHAAWQLELAQALVDEAPQARWHVSSFAANTLEHVPAWTDGADVVLPERLALEHGSEVTPAFGALTLLDPAPTRVVLVTDGMLPGALDTDLMMEVLGQVGAPLHVLYLDPRRVYSVSAEGDLLAHMAETSGGTMRPAAAIGDVDPVVTGLLRGVEVADLGWTSGDEVRPLARELGEGQARRWAWVRDGAFPSEVVAVLDGAAVSWTPTPTSESRYVLLSALHHVGGDAAMALATRAGVVAPGQPIALGSPRPVNEVSADLGELTDTLLTSTRAMPSDDTVASWLHELLDPAIAACIPKAKKRARLPIAEVELTRREIVWLRLGELPTQDHNCLVDAWSRVELDERFDDVDRQALSFTYR